jgi:group I intron endonuclease
MLRWKTPQAGVYRLVNLFDDKVYVGGTVHLFRRKCSHFSLLKLGKHHSDRLQAAYNIYGRRAFRFEVIQTLSPGSDIHAVEQKYIDEYRSFDPEHGYNIAPKADSTVGVPCSRKKKELIGIANTGKVRPEEAKRKCSEWTRNRNLNAGQEMYRKIAESARLRHSTPKEKARARAMGLQNRKYTDDQVSEMVMMKKSGIPVKEISKKFGCSLVCVYDSIKRQSLQEASC